MNIPESGRIFAVGLNKTGTTTLGQALTMLGVPTIDYPTDSRTLEQLEQGAAIVSTDGNEAVVSDEKIAHYKIGLVIMGAIIATLIIVIIFLAGR